MFLALYNLAFLTLTVGGCSVHAELTEGLDTAAGFCQLAGLGLVVYGLSTRAVAVGWHGELWRAVRERLSNLRRAVRERLSNL